MNQKKLLLLVVLVLATGAVGYVLGDSLGYKRAEADIKAVELAAAEKAAVEAAKAANPFQAANPLETVELNPFEKAKKVLNPFE